MQYFCPGDGFFVGDCMPFFHDGTFHLYYLLDEEHHQGRGGLGGHQWAHASSRDLVHWQHHPLALPLTEPYESSICTGSIFYHDGCFYAFYATRLAEWREYISVATSRDGIHFEKRTGQRLISPPLGYDPVHFRDPFVFRDEATGQFHMLVTAARTGARFLGRGGCLAHFTSPDLQRWSLQEPFLTPGHLDRPECPDLFYWNGWYYLVYSIDSTTHYRFSRQPLGPWQRPPVDALDGLMVHVFKTAAFHGNRRLAAGYLASLHGPGGSGKWPYAGNVIFRELVQHEDGSLGTRFPPEMMPPRDEPVDLPFVALGDGVVRQADGAVHLSSWQGFSAAALDGVPHDVHIRMRIEPRSGSNAFGLCLRGRGHYEGGHELRLSPFAGKVEVRRPQDPTYVDTSHHALFNVRDLDKPLTLDVVLKGDIVDICVDNRRCLANRFLEQRGERLFFFCQEGEVTFRDVEVRPLRGA